MALCTTKYLSLKNRGNNIKKGENILSISIVSFFFLFPLLFNSFSPAKSVIKIVCLLAILLPYHKERNRLATEYCVVVIPNYKK